MKASYEKLPLKQGQSFRCFDRRVNRLPARWHRHPEYELTFVPGGDGSRLVGDHIGTYADNDLVLLGSNLPHNWSSDEFRGQKIDMHEGIVTQFHPELLGQGFFTTAELQPIGELLRRSQRGLWYPPEFAKTIGQRLKVLMQQSGPRRLIGLLDCLTELSEFRGAIELATEGYVGPSSSSAESRMQLVCEYTQQHFADSSLTAGRLAATLEMNPSAFCRFFKQSTGVTPSAYLSELRIGFACRKLLDSDKSILSVCHESGFASTSHFNDMFRKLRGMSPRQYRLDHTSLQVSDAENGCEPTSGRTADV